jgi:hypothetical protein
MSYEYCVRNENDIQKVCQEVDKIENLHLDLRSTKLNNEDFDKLINGLQQSKNERIFKMDIKDWTLDDDKVNKIANCLKNWNLYHFSLNMSNVSLTDRQFDELLLPLRNMNNLEILHLIMENVEMDDYKRRSLQKLVREMKNLRSVHINIRSNKISRDALADFRSLLEPIPIRQLLWDDDLLF